MEMSAHKYEMKSIWFFARTLLELDNKIRFIRKMKQMTMKHHHYLATIYTLLRRKSMRNEFFAVSER